jgi:hypothetical protein
MSTSLESSHEFETFRESLYEEGQHVGVFRPEWYVGKETPIREKRRVRRPGFEIDDARMAMTLTEVDGVLRWSDGYGYRRTPGMRRSRFGHGMEGRIIAPINFERLEPNKIGEYLRDLDKRLTPECNFENPNLELRELVNGEWQNPGVRPIEKGRILLFVHGTFSKSKMYTDELGSFDEGKKFLARIQNGQNYDQVLAFDHSTLALSPILNAMDLAKMFAGCKANIDVISHSRGGLVTRWWLEGYDPRPAGSTRAILVGSPLAGTSLAAAPSLRAVINLLTNIARALDQAAELASTAFPFLTVISGLLKVLGSAGLVMAKTPLVDAAISLIPGLLSQAMVSNNEELNRLNRGLSFTPDYYAICSDFRPINVGWEFWKHFNNFGLRASDWAADLVFKQANDLVVDSGSMRVLARFPIEVQIVDDRSYVFPIDKGVYHTVYFRQQATVEKIENWLQLN